MSNYADKLGIMVERLVFRLGKMTVLSGLTLPSIFSLFNLSFFIPHIDYSLGHVPSQNPYMRFQKFILLIKFLHQTPIANIE